MGIALPQFLLNIDGARGGILLICIVGVCILLPLVVAVVYLSRSSKYTENYVKNDTLCAYFHLTKPSLAPRPCNVHHMEKELEEERAARKAADAARIEI